MSKYVVTWAELGRLSPIKNKKLFESPSADY